MNENQKKIIQRFFTALEAWHTYAHETHEGPRRAKSLEMAAALNELRPQIESWIMGRAIYKGTPMGATGEDLKYLLQFLQLEITLDGVHDCGKLAATLEGVLDSIAYGDDEERTYLY